MTVADYISNYGALWGLVVYILIHDLIPFARDKWWPVVTEKEKEKILMRREADARLLDLDERRIIAEEQTAKNLIIMNERLSASEKTSRIHDERMLAGFKQFTDTQAAMQTALNVLLDRIVRPAGNE